MQEDTPLPVHTHIYGFEYRDMMYTTTRSLDFEMNTLGLAGKTLCGRSKTLFRIIGFRIIGIIKQFN